MTSFNKYKWLGLLVLLVLLLAAWRWVAAVPRVETVFARKQAVVDLVIASGRIQSGRQSQVGSEVSGQVKQVRVREGDTVAAGQLLLELDDMETRQRLEQAHWAAETARKELERLRQGAQKEEINRARSELEKAGAVRFQAEQDHNRMQSLFEQKIIPKADLERSRATLDQALAVEKSLRSTLELLLRQPLVQDVEVMEARVKEKEAGVRVTKSELGKRGLTAPFKGLVIRRNVEPGQSVTPGMGLLTLADLDLLEIYVEIDENNISKVRKGQEAVVITPAYRDQPFRARLIRIGPEVDSGRGVIALRFLPMSVPSYIRPDMTVDVNIEVARFPEVCTLPTTTVLEEKGKSFIYLVEKGRAKRREVRLLSKGPEWVALADFDPKAVVVLRGTEVKEGQRIRAR
jgi:HlyD family secretion protein